jgi:hypothetical protein
VGIAEVSCGNGQGRRQTRRKKKVHSSSNIYSLERDKENHVTHIKDSIKVKRQKGKDKVEALTTHFYSFPLLCSQ